MSKFNVKALLLLLSVVGILCCVQKAKHDHICEVVAVHTSPDTLTLYMVLVNSQDSVITANGRFIYDLAGDNGSDYRSVYAGDKNVTDKDFGFYVLDKNYPSVKTRALRIGNLTAEDFAKWPDNKPSQLPPLSLYVMDINLHFITADGDELTQKDKLVTHPHFYRWIKQALLF